jgi:outer membrane receptor for ferrienterochelin and colicins
VEVVVTGTRTAEDKSKAIVRVDTVTREEAARRGATNVGEAIAGELGLQVNPSANGAIGRASSAQIGGLDRERVLVLEDGERVVGDVGGAIDLSQLSLGGVDRIEITQGPSSSLYGSSAMGGVVQLVSGPPEREGWSGRFQLEGRYRWGGLGLGEVAYRKEDKWVAANATFYGSEGVSLSPPNSTIPDLYRVGAQLRAGMSLTKRADIMVKTRWGREAGLGLESQDVPGLGEYLTNLPDVTNRFSILVREKTTIGEEHELTLSVAKQWFWNQTTSDRQDSPLDTIRDRFHTMHSIEAVGTFFQDSKVSFVTGARGEVEAFDQVLDKAVFADGGVKHEVLTEVEPTTLGKGALYGELRVDPWPAFSAVAGARLEGNSTYGVDAAPRVAIAVRPLKALTIRASGGRGFRAPSAKEIGFVFDHSVYGYKVVGNPDLLPETSWGVQAGVDWKITRGLEWKTSGYANWVSDLIDLRATGRGEAGVDEYTYVNVGDARTFGVETKLRAIAGKWLRAEAGYAYLFTSDDERDVPLPGRPPHTFFVSAKLDTPIGFSAYARLRGVTSAYLNGDDLGTPPAGTVLLERAPGFANLDVRLGQTFARSIEVYGGVLNLLGVEKNIAWIGDQRPVEGRTFYLGIRGDLPPPEDDQ